MPKISIIVPVYKSEKYLSRCIDSILAQTVKDFEIILIDDGSPDGSGKICDEYVAKDNRIKVIHQENKGASAARNRGIAESTGEYLMFCDSDDFVSPMWAERLLSLAEGDILPIGVYCHNIDLLGKEKTLSIPANTKLPNSEYYRFNQAGIAGYLCNALYRRDIVTANKITLREKAQEGDYNEDLIFALTYASKIKYIAYTGYADYLYDTREDSMSHSFDKYYFAKYREKYILWRAFINDNCKEDCERQKKDLATKMLYHFLVALDMESKSYKAFKEIVLCDEMQEIVNIADYSNENPRIIKLINSKHTLALYAIYLLQNLKRRCKK